MKIYDIDIEEAHRMMAIHVSLATEDPFSSYVYGPTPSELTFSCVRYRAGVYGGCIDAVVNVSGPEHVLWSTLEWLRRPIELRNGAGQVVWWGYIQEVELQIGSRKIGVSLDDMANRIRVAYAQEREADLYKRQDTAVLNDVESQSRYGIKELIHSMGESTAERANAKAAELLEKKRRPQMLQTFSASGGQISATLYCAGWVETLKWRTYQRVGSRIIFNAQELADDQAIGWQLQSTDIFFTRRAGIHDLYARLDALAVGNRIYVTGSGVPSNNTEYTIVRSTSDKRVVYTANTISFESNDDIFDSANGFSFVRDNALVRISGSAQNSGIREIDGVKHNGYITTSSLGGLIVDEPAGQLVTMEQGHEVEVTPIPQNSLDTSGSKTITLYGYRLAQSFTSTFSGLAGRIRLKVGKAGNPTDSLRVALCENNNGQPGAILAFALVASADISEKTDWMWIDLTPAPTLNDGSVYWLVIERTGALDPVDYYKVGMTAAAAGSCLAYTGSAWVANPAGAYLLHEVWQIEETTEQIRQIVESSGQFIADVAIEAASGIFDNPERTGDKNAYDEVLKLLEAGQASGTKLLFDIDSNRIMRIYAQPSKQAKEPDIYTLSGRIMMAAGGPKPEGVLPVGEWVAIEKTPKHLDLSPVFVEEAEYDAQQRTIIIKPE